MQLVEVADVADADLQEEIEVAGDQMAIQHEPQFPDREFESPKTLRRRTVEHHADNHQRAALEFFRRQLGSDAADEAFVEKPLRAAVTGGRADVNRRGEVGVGDAAVTLQQLQDFAVDAVDSGLEVSSAFLAFINSLSREFAIMRSIIEQSSPFLESTFQPRFAMVSP